MVPENMQVEVAYATPQEQRILTLEVPVGSTLEQALGLSGIEEHFPDIDLANSRFGIFGKLAGADASLRPGDRVEVYRPLLADPKEARKKRAAKGKTMKKGAGAAPATKN